MSASSLPGDHLTSLLASGTVVSADTTDVAALERLKPQDTTTNPTMINASRNLPEYEALARESASTTSDVSSAMYQLAVGVGLQLMSRVPGYVSTEVDARDSFDTEATVARALDIVKLYEEKGIDAKKRLLLKVAGTWEGIQAAKQLEEMGYGTNVTLVFSLAQAVAAAQAKCTLISPFVGRMLDWHKKARGVDAIPVQEDPGVLSVRTIQKIYRDNGWKTICMGASFRSADEVRALAGVDRLTVAPKLLDELKATEGSIPPFFKDGEGISAIPAWAQPGAPHLRESEFRYHLNADACATEKLAEGIRMFAKDTDELQAFMTSLQK